MPLLVLALSCRFGYVCTDCDDSWALDPELDVTVPKHDLPPGKTITLDALTMVWLWRKAVPDDVLVTVEEIVGRVPRERILVGEPIREERLVPYSNGVGWRAVVPADSVGVAVAADGFVPGQVVDLLITDRGHTRTLLEGQRIVALRGGEVPLLAVPRADAPRVEAALAEGLPTLVLRSDQDFPPCGP